MGQVVHLADGHVMNIAAYKAKEAHFGNVLAMNGARVVHAGKPNNNYDYCYTLANFKELTQEMQTWLIKANLVAKVTKIIGGIACVHLRPAGFKHD